MSSHSELQRTSSRSSVAAPCRLLQVGPRVGVDLLRREHGPGGRAPGRVAHARGVVADDQHHACGRGPGTRAASASRPSGRGGCRRPSGPARASRAAAAPPRRRPERTAGGRDVDRVSGQELRASGRLRTGSSSIRPNARVPPLAGLPCPPGPLGREPPRRRSLRLARFDGAASLP